MMVDGHKINEKSASLIWEALSFEGEEKFRNGITACFWNLMGIIDSHLKESDEDSRFCDLERTTL